MTPTLERLVHKVELRGRECDDEFWLDVYVNGADQPRRQIGPFETASRLARATDDLLEILRSKLGYSVYNAGIQ